MAYTIALTKRTNGGYTVVSDGVTSYPSELTYHGTEDGVILFSRGLNLIRFYRPTEWTIQTVATYTTVTEICDALDALGVLPADTLEDIEALLTTIDADTGDIKTAIELIDDDVDAIRVSAAVIDDWDESDRAKVNLIASQAGVDGNSGNKSDKTVRVVLATDQPQLTNSLKTVDNNGSAIKTAVELIDDSVVTLGTTTYTEASNKGLVIGAFRRDAETTMVDTTNEAAPLQVDVAGRLKVTTQGRVIAPVVLVAAGAAQNVTTGWVDLGSEITTNGAHTLALWTVVTNTDSVNDRVRILAKHTGSTGAEFTVPIKTISSTDVKVQGHYYELDTDETQNIVLDWDVSAVPVVQVQISCETVGAVADTISADYTLMY